MLACQVPLFAFVPYNFSHMLHTQTDVRVRGR
jgi:hypothetical protein